MSDEDRLLIIFTSRKTGRRIVIPLLPHAVRHTLLRPAFWIGLTLGFPLEHLLWEKLWPFDILTRWLGL